MSALPEETITMSEAEYLAFERTSEVKHEYIDGVVSSEMTDEYRKVTFETETDE